MSDDNLDAIQVDRVEPDVAVPNDTSTDAVAMDGAADEGGEQPTSSSDRLAGRSGDGHIDRMKAAVRRQCGDCPGSEADKDFGAFLSTLRDEYWPLRWIVDHLTDEDVAYALRRMDKRSLWKLLSGLGLRIRPHSVTPRLARDVRARTKAMDDEKIHVPLIHMTEGLWDQLRISGADAEVLGLANPGAAGITERPAALRMSDTLMNAMTFSRICTCFPFQGARALVGCHAMGVTWPETFPPEKWQPLVMAAVEGVNSVVREVAAEEGQDNIATRDAAGEAVSPDADDPDAAATNVDPINNSTNSDDATVATAGSHREDAPGIAPGDVGRAEQASATDTPRGRSGGTTEHHGASAKPTGESTMRSEARVRSLAVGQGPAVPPEQSRPDRRSVVAAVEDLQSLVAAAAEAADRAAVRLSGGRPPDRDDVEILVRVRVSFTEVVAALEQQLTRGTDLSIDGSALDPNVTDLLDAARRQEASAGITSALIALLGLQGPARYAGAIDMVRTLVRDQLRRPDEGIAEALAALCTLVRNSDQLDDDVHDNLSTTARTALPAELATFVTAAGRGKLDIDEEAVHQVDQDALVDQVTVSASQHQAANRIAEALTGNPEAPAPAAAADTRDTAAKEHGPEPELGPESAETDLHSVDETTLAGSTEPAIEPAAAVIPPVDEPAGDVPVESGPAVVDPEESTDRTTDEATEVTTTGDPGNRSPVACEATPNQATIDTAPEDTLTDKAWTAVAKLLCEHRFGLAAHLVETLAPTTRTVPALRAITLAAVVQTQTSSCATAVRAAVADLSADDILAEPYTRILSATALTRAALVTGDAGIGALLNQLPGRVETGLEGVLQPVTKAALQNMLSGGTAQALLSDRAKVEQDITFAVETARSELTRRRILRFKRASDIAGHWTDAHGILGTALAPVLDDRRDLVETVAQTIVDLNSPGQAGRHIDDLDKQLRGHSGKPVEGASRHDLVALYEDVLRAASRWIELVRASARADAGHANAWTVRGLDDMRRDVTAALPAAESELAVHRDSHDPLLSAAAHAALDELDEIRALLSGEALPGTESSPQEALSGELLKIPGCRQVGQDIVAPDPLTLAQLLSVCDQDFVAAFENLLAAEQLTAALSVLGIIERGAASRRDAEEFVAPHPSGVADPRTDRKTKPEAGAAADTERIPENLRSRFEAAVDAHRQTLIQMDTVLRQDLVRARRQNILTDEQDGEIDALLADANPTTRGRYELDDVASTLSVASGIIASYRQDAVAALHERLHHVITTDPRAPDRIRKLIDDGELATADELLNNLETDEELPSGEVREDLEAFFPAIPKGLSRGINDGVIAAARAGAQHAGLDFSGLWPEQKENIATCLEIWRTAGQFSTDRRYNFSLHDYLTPVLHQIGVEAIHTAAVDAPKHNARRFFDLLDVTITGKRLVPDFGSKLNCRLRVMVVWGAPTPETLLDWLPLDKSTQPIVVVYYGTLSPQARIKLAQEAPTVGRPFVVLDDAAVAYMLAQGGRKFATATRILLPFTVTHPFVRSKKDPVYEEIFYGRDRELAQLLSAEGASLVYGGRSLGKSAALREAQRQFVESPHHIALYEDLNRFGLAQDPSALWAKLHHELEEKYPKMAGALQAERRRKATTVPSNHYDRVVQLITQWLNKVPQGRILLLLDECDDFFNADAPQFIETNRLKDLMTSTHGRCKVVMSGLHQVQRFATISNQPFRQLGQPLVIRPFRPAAAYALIAGPFEAMGYRFVDGAGHPAPDLINAIAAHCNYQPYLLQIFAGHLLEHMNRRRPQLGAPPYPITEADVDAIRDDTELEQHVHDLFDETLALDWRYKVIANVMALAAYAQGLAHHSAEHVLLRECQEWWPEGFTGQLGTIDAFRALLVEMNGLGVLAKPESRGWRLRGPNVLRMIGTSEDATQVLLSASEESVPDQFRALAQRQVLSNGRRSPLTAQQMADVLPIERRNQARIILATPALGGADVVPAIQQACAEVGDRYTLQEPTKSREYERALTTGEPGRRNLVLSDMRITSRLSTCQEALHNAVSDMLPTQPGVTRAVVLVSAPDHLNWWEELLAGGPDSVGTVVPLRRYDRRAMAVWAVDSEHFTSDTGQGDLLSATDGWPLLVERVSELARGRGERRALAKLQDEMATGEGAATFISSVGLVHGHPLYAIVDGLVEWIDESISPRADVEAISSMHGAADSTSAVALLEALGVLTADKDGLKLSCVLAAAWKRAREARTISAP